LQINARKYMAEEIKPNPEEKPASAKPVLEPEVRGREEKFYYYPPRRYDGGIMWGLVFVFAGIMLLLNTTQTVPWSVWNYIWPFWPLFLILIGVRIILGKSLQAEIIASVAAFLLLAFVAIYALIQINSGLVDYLPRGITDFVGRFDFPEPSQWRRR
jgi:hypothetical protein